MFTDKTLLITGGTGSFGNAVLDRFLDTGVREIRIFSRDEKKQDDMRLRYRNPKIKFYIGDVRDPNSIRSSLSDYSMPTVSDKVVRIILSYIDYINRNVWGKQMAGPSK